MAARKPIRSLPRAPASQVEIPRTRGRARRARARARLRQERREHRVVLDVADRVLAGQRDLHARDSAIPPDRTRASPAARARARARTRRAMQQRSAQRPSPCSPESEPPSRRGEIHDIVENAGDAVAPIIATHIDRADSRARAHRRRDRRSRPRVVRRERGANAAHVVSESLRRNDAVLDELHRLESGIESREDRARRVAKLPQSLLFIVIEPDRDRASRRRARARQRVDARCRRGVRVVAASSSMSSTASVSRGHRQRTEPRAATSRNVRSSSSHALASPRSRLRPAPITAASSDAEAREQTRRRARKLAPDRARRRR